MKELINLSQELLDKGDDRGLLLMNLINEQNPLKMETKLGTLQALKFEPTDEFRELYIDLVTPNGETYQVACISVEETEDDELEVVSRLWLDSQIDYKSRYEHGIKGQLLLHLRAELEDQLKELIEADVYDTSVMFLDKFRKREDAVSIILKDGVTKTAEDIINGIHT